MWRLVAVIVIVLIVYIYFLPSARRSFLTHTPLIKNAQSAEKSHPVNFGEDSPPSVDDIVSRRNHGARPNKYSITASARKKIVGELAAVRKVAKTDREIAE